jgi:hypothetical protein
MILPTEMIIQAILKYIYTLRVNKLYRKHIPVVNNAHR